MGKTKRTLEDFMGELEPHFLQTGEYMSDTVYIKEDVNQIMEEYGQYMYEQGQSQNESNNLSKINPKD